MRDHILFFLNGQKIRVVGRDAFSMLAPYLRQIRGLTGTKIACAHGACGSCSVLVGRPGATGKIAYQTVNACIFPVFLADGAHLITVEGLNGAQSVSGQDDGVLSPIQSAMVECHGAQCGFCTPGIVIALTAFHQEKHAPIENPRAEVQSALEGNLCRCTGYAPIVEAGTSVETADLKPLGEIYPESQWREKLGNGSAESVEIRVAANELESEMHLFSPRSLEEAASWKTAYPGAVVIAGATEVGVAMSVKGFAPPMILSLARVEGCDEVEAQNGALILGARANWTKVERATREIAPEFSALLSRWGSPQLRNAGTVAGSIMNASAISDSIPFLLVCNAELEFLGANGARRVKVAEFLENPSEVACGELLRRVIAPLPRENQRLRLYKISKRRAFDRSIVSAAFLATLSENRIEEIKIAVGGVGETVLRLGKTEAFLRGQTSQTSLWREAGSIAQSEIAPISDAAASREYRLQLVAGLLRRFGSE